jgi:outer membrane protein assembly factor BamB
MKNVLHVTVLLFVALCAPLHAADNTTPGRLDVDPPTLIGLGFEWYLEGDDNENAELVVDFCKEGEPEWRPSLQPFYRRPGTARTFGLKLEMPTAHFAGSIIDLEEDTPYDVRLTLSDPDGVGGEAVRTFTARTRKVPEAFAGGRKIEVGGDTGATLESVLPKLQPGDTVLLHAGTYTPPAFEAPASPKSADGPRVDTSKPAGRVLHVYPRNYKGEKQEPNFPSIMTAYHGSTFLYDTQFHMVPDGAQPGDTVLVHTGLYRTNPFSYRDHLSMWQHGARRFTRKGTAQKPIVVKAAGDGPVAIDAGGAYCAFDLLDAAHHVIEGLTIRNAFIGLEVARPQKGMVSKGLVVQDCTIKGVRTGVVGAGSTELKLVNTTIEEDAFADRQEGTYLVTADGTAEKPIAFKPFGDGEVIIDGGDGHRLLDVMAADHLIFEGLTFRNAFTALCAGLRGPRIGSTGLAVKNCRFEDVQNGVMGLSPNCRSLTVLDSVFLGRQGGSNPGGYAVDLAGAGHAVGYNYSHKFWDHLNVSTSTTMTEGNRSYNIDIYNNICARARDNIFEADGTMWNTRFMRNLCSYANSFAFSSQPTIIGPSYYIRNALYWGGGFKFVMGSSGAHAYHNTLIGGPGLPRRHAVNNLILDEKGSTPDDFKQFVNVPAPNWEHYPRDKEPVDVRKLDFQLRGGSAAIDAGQVIRGLNEDYTGKAPDLGALECGKPSPHYGPRATHETDREVSRVPSLVSWGNMADRNMVFEAHDLAVAPVASNAVWRQDWKLQHLYSQPAVAYGRLLVGCSGVLSLPAADGAETRYNHSQVRCLDLESGNEIWKLALGYSRYGVVGTFALEGDRVYFIHGMDFLCVDLDGMADGNDGAQIEVEMATTNRRERDGPAGIGLPDGAYGDIFWRLDLKALGVGIHDAASGTPLVLGDTVWVTTSQDRGVRPASAQQKSKREGPPRHDPNIRIPNVVVVDKRTGRLLALDDQPIPEVFHSQWGSLSSGIVEGRRLVFWGDGYGILHAFEVPDSYPAAGEAALRLTEAWRVDANPRHYRYDPSGRERGYPWTMGRDDEVNALREGGPGHIISTPVFHDGRVYVAIGRDGNYCLKGGGRFLGQGAVTCVDPAGAGDVTESHVLWRQTDVGRFQATPSVADGRLYLAGMDGHLYCLDASNGRIVYRYDLERAVAERSQFLADGKLYVANRSGEFFVFRTGPIPELLFRERPDVRHPATPTACGDLLILAGSREIGVYRRGGGLL